MVDEIRSQTWTILDGTDTAAAAIKRGHMDLVAIELDAAFDGTALTFLVGRTAALCTHALQYEGTAVSFTAAASDHLAFDPVKFAGAAYIKVVSDANQSGADTVLRPIFRDLSAG